MSTGKGVQLFSLLRPRNTHSHDTASEPVTNGRVYNRSELSHVSDCMIKNEHPGHFSRKNSERNQLTQKMFVNEMEGYRLLACNENVQAAKFLARALDMRIELCNQGYGGGIGFSPEIAKLYCSLGRVHAELGDFCDAHENLRKGIVIYERIKLRHNQAIESEEYQRLLDLEEFVRNVLLADEIQSESFRRFVKEREQREQAFEYPQYFDDQDFSVTCSNQSENELLEPNAAQSSYDFYTSQVTPESNLDEEEQDEQAFVEPHFATGDMSSSYSSENQYEISPQHEEKSGRLTPRLSQFGELETIGEEADPKVLAIRLELARVDLKLNLVEKARDRLLIALEKSKHVDCEDDTYALNVVKILELLGDIECDFHEDYSAGRAYYKDALKLVVEEYGSHHEHHDVIFSKMLGIAGLF